MEDSNLTQEACIKMLNTFRCCDLKVLLKGFAKTTYKHKYKNKEELKSCALQCLTKNDFKLNIWNMYHSINAEGSSILRSNNLILETDRIEFNDVSMNNNFKDLFTQFPYQIKFKKLLFCDDISEVIKDTVLCNSSKYIL